MATPIDAALRDVLDAALVRLDHALEQAAPGDLTLEPELQARIAALLPRCHRIATPWLVLDEDGQHEARFALGAPHHQGMIGGLERLDRTQPGLQGWAGMARTESPVEGWAESLLQRRFRSASAARQAIDASLRADGYLLL